ncbi:MAG: ABC transporter permease [Bacteroidales bacterium]
MNKINIIIAREYLSRVKKKSFIVMTVLGPLLFAALMIAPAWIASMEDTEVKTVAVIDSSGLFQKRLPETEYIKFTYLQNQSVEEVRESFEDSGYYALLYIPHIITYVPNGVQLYSDKQAGFGLTSHISGSIEKIVEQQKMQAAGVKEEVLQSIRTDVNIRTIQWTKDGKQRENSTVVTTILGYISGFLIYMFIFMFGAQVMRGVIEEKTSRIVEIIVSSAKPFQLMMGKIVGLGLVGLTQFMLWVVLTLALVSVGKATLFPELGTPNTQEVVTQNIMSQQPGGEQLAEANDIANPDKIQEIFSAIGQINFVVVIGAFLFYFLGGYLLYSSLFAAVGAAVDNETETQQFMLPITIPLILGFIIMMNAVQNPQGSLAFWGSIIPFTSPIVMMVRIPFGVPIEDFLLSAGLLVLTFIGTTWLAGKIYRTGILMYGKKVNYKELWKWIRYKY